MYFCDPVYKQTSNLRKAEIKIQFMKVGQLKWPCQKILRIKFSIRLKRKRKKTTTIEDTIREKLDISEKVS